MDIRALYRCLASAALAVLMLVAPNVDAQVVLPPELQCVSVMPNGGANLTWTQPADPGSVFDSYKAFFSTNENGPFGSYFTTTNYNLLNFTGIAIPTTGPVYFYIQSFYTDVSGVTTMGTSDTLSTIFLSVSNQLNGGQSTGFAELNWNEYNSSFVTPQDEYVLYRHYAGTSAFAPIDTLPYGTTSYLDPVKVCIDSNYYYVRIVDAGCDATSNQVVEEIEDTRDPEIPVIDSVSVDTATGMVSIGWQPSISPETDGYIVYNFGSSPDPDTLYGINSTFFIDSFVDASIFFEAYGVAAFDTCWVNGAPNTSPTDVLHTTVFTSLAPDACDRTMTIDWTAYQGWDQGVETYTVYGRDVDSAWAVIAVVDGSTIDFVHTGLETNHTYEYFVRARSFTGATSTSNLVEETLSVSGLPLFHYLKRVTVDRGSPSMAMFVDTLAEISHYSIQRSLVPGAEYTEVDTIVPTEDSVWVFRDKNANADSLVWYYRVVVVDTCGNEIVVSNLGNTMKMGARIRQETLDVTLDWTSYDGWEEFGTGVGQVDVYRWSNNWFDTIPIATLPGDARSYVDNLSDEYNSTGEVCYYVEAVEGTASANPHGYRDSSSSNVFCVFIKPRVYVPNAFTPNGDGLNDVWTPGLFFSDLSNYQLTVFSRWGQPVFTSTNPTEGWDGKVKGGLPSAGSFVYHLTYRNGQGEAIEKVGTIVVMR